VRRCC